jgi:hypothetical protein
MLGYTLTDVTVGVTNERLGDANPSDLVLAAKDQILPPVLPSD